MYSLSVHQPTYETRRVVVFYGLCIAECLEDRISLQELRLQLSLSGERERAVVYGSLAFHIRLHNERKKTKAGQESIVLT